MATTKKNTDITKTGAQSYKDLQKQNSANQKVVTADEAFDKNWQKHHFTGAQGAAMDTQAMTHLADEKIRTSLYNEKTGDYFGNSIFDDDYVMGANIESVDSNLSDLRAENEPWYAKIAAGVGKGVVTAATTVLGDIGLIYGIGQGIYNLFDGNDKTGFLSGLWDNPITNALQDINEFSEKWMPNYYTRYEQENPFTFNANFLGDKIIKNFGFMVGAFYGGIPVSSALGKVGSAIVKSKRASNMMKAEELLAKANQAKKEAQAVGKSLGETTEQIATRVNSKLTELGLDAATRQAKYLEGLDNIRTWANATRHTTQLLGHLTSAIVEGTVEAVGNTRDWRDLKYQEVDDDVAAKKQAIIDQYGEGSAEALARFEILDKEAEKKKAAIEEERTHVGNADFLMNLPVLLASNMIQYGKLMSRGFKSTQRQMGSWLNGHKLKGKLADGTLRSGKTWKGAIGASLKNATSEGMEEYLQRAASDAAGNSASESLKNYINADKDYKSTWGVGDYLCNFAKAVKDNATNASALEEFSIGAISSLLGMPTFGHSHTKDAYVGKGKAFGLSGGLVGEVRDYLKEKSHEETIANYLNERIKDPEFKSYYQGLIRNHRFEDLKQEALRVGDKKAYKDAEFDQLFSDINAAASAGHLEEFKALIGYNQEYSDDELDDIVKNTTTIKTAQQQIAEDEQKLKLLQETYNKEREAEKINEANSEKADRNRSNQAILAEQIQELSDKLDPEKRADNYKDKQEGPFLDQDGRALNSYDNGKEKMREVLEKNRTSLLQTIDDFLKVRNDVDIETDGQLDDEQISLLSYMKAKILNIEQRSIDMKGRLFDEDEGSLTALQEGYKQEISFLKSYIEDLQMLEDNPDLERLLKGAQDKLKLLQFKHDRLEDMKNMDSETFQAYMTQSSYAAFLIADVANTKNALEYNKRQEAGDLLRDIMVLAHEKIAYNKKLNEFLGNPSEINAAYRDAANQLDQETIDKQSTELTEKLNKVKSIRDLHNLLSDPNLDQRVADKALENIEASEDENLKALVKDYKDANKIYDTFIELLNRQNYSPEIANSILESVDEIHKRAMEIDDAEVLTDNPECATRTDWIIKQLESLADLYEQEGQQELADKVRELLSKYTEAKQATNNGAQAGKGRKRKPKKKPKTDNKEGDTKDNEEGDQKKNPKNDPKNDPTNPPKDSGNNNNGNNNDNDNKITKEDVKQVVLDHTENLDLEDLLDLAKDPSALNNHPIIAEYLRTNPEDLTLLYLNTIQKRIDDIVRKNGEISTAASIDRGSSQLGSDRSARMQQKQATSYVSYGVTEYRIFNDNGYLAESRTPYEPKDSIGKKIQGLLKKYGAYDFVDKGFLGAIWKASNVRPKIFYVKSTDPELAGSTFLAIEMDGDARKAIDRAFGQASKSLSFQTVELDYNGEKKKFQIVGQLGITEGATEDVKNSYSRLQGLLSDEFEKAKSDEKLASQPFIVSTHYNNELTGVNTGRLDISENKQSLYDFMQTSIIWKSPDIYISFEVIQKGKIVSGNINNCVYPNSEWMDKNNGAVIMFVRKADGELYPIRCTRRSVEDWLNKKADATHTGADLLNSAIEGEGNSHIRHIVDLCRQLLNSKDLNKQIRAKTLLSRYFILGTYNNGSPIQIDSATGEVTIFGNKIGTNDDAQAISSIFNVLAAHDVLFTLPSVKFDHGQNGREIVESGIMEVGLAQYDNFNASFNIAKTDNDGNIDNSPIEAPEPTNHFRRRAGIITVGDNTYKYKVDEKGRVTYERKLFQDDNPVDNNSEQAILDTIYHQNFKTVAEHNNFPIDTPELAKYQNTMVITNSNGEVVAFYIKNNVGKSKLVTKPILKIPGIKGNFEKIQRDINDAIQKAVNRRTAEMLAAREENNKDNQEGDNTNNTDNVDTEDQTNTEETQTGDQQETTTTTDTSGTTTTTDTTDTSGEGTSEGTTEGTDTTENGNSENTEEGDKKPPRGQVSHVMDNEESDNYSKIRHSTVMLRNSGKTGKLRQRILDSLIEMEKQGYINLEGEDFDTVRDILKDPKNAAEKWEKFEKEKMCG